MFEWWSICASLHLEGLLKLLSNLEFTFICYLLTLALPTELCLDLFNFLPDLTERHPLILSSHLRPLNFAQQCFVTIITGTVSGLVLKYSLSLCILYNLYKLCALIFNRLVSQLVVWGVCNSKGAQGCLDVRKGLGVGLLELVSLYLVDFNRNNVLSIKVVVVLLGEVVEGAIVAEEETTVSAVILSQDKILWMFRFWSLTIFLIPLHYFSSQLQWTYQSMINRRQLVISSLEFFTAGWAYFFILVYKRFDTFFADGVTTR